MSPEIISSPDGEDVGGAVGNGDGDGEEIGVALVVGVDVVGAGEGVGEGISLEADVLSGTGSSAAADPTENGSSVDATSELATRRPRHLGAVIRFDVRTTCPLAR